MHLVEVIHDDLLQNHYKTTIGWTEGRAPLTLVCRQLEAREVEDAKRVCAAPVARRALD
jgi:hypothetical protein